MGFSSSWEPNLSTGRLGINTSSQREAKSALCSSAKTPSFSKSKVTAADSRERIRRVQVISHCDQLIKPRVGH